jgi:hypothetical protein
LLTSKTASSVILAIAILENKGWKQLRKKNKQQKTLCYALPITPEITTLIYREPVRPQKFIKRQN